MVQAVPKFVLSIGLLCKEAEEFNNSNSDIQVKSLNVTFSDQVRVENLVENNQPELIDVDYFNEENIAIMVYNSYKKLL